MTILGRKTEKEKKPYISSQWDQVDEPALPEQDYLL